MTDEPPDQQAQLLTEARRIAGLVPQWSGRTLQIAALEDVISLNNANYRVRVDDEEYVLRVAATTARFLGVTREDEHNAARAAAEAGICPPVLYADADGHLVTRFVRGRHWEPHEFHEPANMARVADTLRRLHAIKGVAANGSVFRRVERLLASAIDLGLALPERVSHYLAELGRLEAERALDRRFRPGLSHNDFWGNNFLDDGERLWLVDWEFGGDGDGLFDLATFSIGARYTDEERAALLAAYGYAEREDLGRLRAMEYAVFFFEGAWALVQHGLRGSGGYDFAAHATRMFGRLDERLAE
jgi:thiamine kinase-like enzyme